MMFIYAGQVELNQKSILGLSVIILSCHLFFTTVHEGHGVTYSHALNKTQRLSRVPDQD